MKSFTLPLQLGDRVRWDDDKVGIVLLDLGKKVVVAVGDSIANQEQTVSKKLLNLILKK
jgi:hypothetical protein